MDNAYESWKNLKTWMHASSRGCHILVSNDGKENQGTGMRHNSRQAEKGNAYKISKTTTKILKLSWNMEGRY